MSVDLSAALKQRGDAASLYLLDGHPNRLGHQVIAEEIAKAIGPRLRR